MMHLYRIISRILMFLVICGGLAPLVAQGRDLPQPNPAGRAVIKGDDRSFTIAAASIIAKVTRDRLMQCYHFYYPQFDFPRHKGYPTKAHKEAIRIHGTCPIHRRSFKGVKEYR